MDDFKRSADEVLSEAIEDAIDDQVEWELDAEDLALTVEHSYLMLLAALGKLPDTHYKRLAREHIDTGMLWTQEAFKNAT
jgi:hypothetical protein